MPRTLPLSRHLGSSPVRWASRSSSDDRSGTSAPSSFTRKRRSSCSSSPAAATSTPGSRCFTTVSSPSSVGRGDCPPRKSRHTATLQAGEHVGHGVDRLARISTTPSQPRRLQGAVSWTIDGRRCPGRPRPGPGALGVAAPLRPAHNLGFKRRRVIVAPPLHWSMWNGNSPKLQTLYIYIGHRYYHHHQSSFAQRYPSMLPWDDAEHNRARGRRNDVPGALALGDNTHLPPLQIRAYGPHPQRQAHAASLP